jgi:3,4-dihydroxy 2-butanone 4-phosphate synthase/GTP cyclohydrolase II
VLYVRGHEGRGIGLMHKLQAYHLQDTGQDTVDANLSLGLPADARDYGTGAQILAELGVRSMRLLTNNPDKRAGLEGYGLSVAARVPLPARVTADNLRYLTTKRDRMGHDLPGLPVLDDEMTEASADALPPQVGERAARLDPGAVRSALRLARALSPFAEPAVTQ